MATPAYLDIRKYFLRLMTRAARHTVTFAAATTGAVAAKELFTVTGEVMLCVIAKCNTDLLGAGSLQLGTENDTDLLVAVTVGTTIDAGELWQDATPAAFELVTATMPQWILVSEEDIGYEVTVGTITAGVIEFTALWMPLSTDGNVVAAGVNAAL